MGEPVSIVAKTAFQQPDAQANLKSQTGGGRAFQDVLQNGAKTGGETPGANTQNVTAVNTQQPTNPVSSAKLDQMQADLTSRVNGIGASQTPLNKSEILPELLYTKSRMGLLGEALSGLKKAPQGTELMGRFKQVEGEYNQLEAMMKSNKDMSPGELLGLQARLYQVSQHIEVMSKVVDQVTGGIKTILNTNV